MVNIKLDGTKEDVMQAIELLQNKTFKDNCSVLEKSWEEDGKDLEFQKNRNVKAEIELYLERRDLYLYQVGDNYGLSLDFTPAPKTKEDMDYSGWEKGGSSYLRHVIEEKSKEYIHEPDGNVYRCIDGVFVTKDGLLRETKISEHSNLPLSVA